MITQIGKLNPNFKHGKARAGMVMREWNVWASMRQRCLDKNSTRYYLYGARGITVCERWLGEHGFENFISDMGERPSAKHSIERINNNGHYTPDNCRWADKFEQGANKRNNVKIEIDGVIKISAQWARESKIGITKSTISKRLKQGWSHRDAVFIPPSKLNWMLKKSCKKA